MRTPVSISPPEFIAFASSIFRERGSAMDCLKNGDTAGAMTHMEYMEAILSDTLAEMAKKSRDEWRTVDNCVAELLANDIPAEIQISHDQAQRFTLGARKTICKFIRHN